MPHGAFTPAARDAILTATLHRCAGCGTTNNIEAHHRNPRRMGGTSNPLIGEPWNGVALCNWHHRWAESHRHTAAALGWIATPDADDPYGPDTPWWCLGWGWCRWVSLDDTDGWFIRILQDSPGPAADDAVAAIPHRQEK